MLNLLGSSNLLELVIRVLFHYSPFVTYQIFFFKNLNFPSHESLNVLNLNFKFNLDILIYITSFERKCSSSGCFQENWGTRFFFFSLLFSWFSFKHISHHNACRVPSLQTLVTKFHPIQSSIKLTKIESFLRVMPS